MDSHKPSTGLLLLPPELRDEIYQYIIIKPKNVITMIWCNNSFQSKNFALSAAQPTLTRVNKQIRAETLPVFYNSNLFSAELSVSEDVAVAKSWLDAIGETNIRNLRSLALYAHARVLLGYGMCVLSIRLDLDLKVGTLKIDGNEVNVAEYRHVVKGMDEMRRVFKAIVDARQGKGFDAYSLERVIERFHEVCTAE